MLPILGLMGLGLFFAFKEIGIIIAIIFGLISFIFAIFLTYSVFLTFSEVAWVLFFYTIATPKEKEMAKGKKLEEKVTTILSNTEAIKTIEIETKE